ncbi:TIGR01777 family oxidoreductase [Pseudidiomarina taiwanensis]|uniref:TIGR01777 family protein n=1 Tax=Pseudidiomarina taiwanensis TaxID=337250 RepID=A0A432ZNS3_9GAMM|nr:TIGR01777 family oxidoreductase [Pseudidiomarina taiwanensis]RUO79544.1 TIGR01777 family protein [Pseudidiomarina taiwanensis]
MKKILITGGTGLIGRELVKKFKPDYQVTVVTRDPQAARKLLGADVQFIENLESLTDLCEFYAVINLQGEGIADKRWSDRQKLRLEQSRWNITRQLSEKILACSHPPAVFISGSAIGIYGPRDQQAVTESTPIEADDFAHQLCAEWERLAFLAEPKTRVCVIRTGVVLAPEGGALAKMLPPYLLGLGGPLGDGKQGFSWIHLDDIVGIICYLVEHEACQGVFNGTAPTPLAQAEFSACLAKVLRKSHFMKVPAFALKLMLGELSEMLLKGQLVLPERIQQAGYQFRYPELEEALKDCLLPPSST